MRQITHSHLNALLSYLLVMIIVYDGRKSYKISWDFQKKMQFVQWNDQFWVLIKFKCSTLRTTRSSWMCRRRRSVVDGRVSGPTRMTRLVRVAVRRSVTRRARPLIGVSVEFRRRYRRLGNEDLTRVVVRPSERRCHHWRAGKLTTSRAATKNDSLMKHLTSSKALDCNF
jgi:hypothetical protein